MFRNNKALFLFMLFWLGLAAIAGRAAYAAEVEVIPHVVLPGPVKRPSLDPASVDPISPHARVPRQYIVRYKTKNHATLAETAPKKRHIRDVKALDIPPRRAGSKMHDSVRGYLDRLKIVRVPVDVDEKEALAELKNNPDVESVQPDHYVRLAALPNEPFFGLNFLWNLHNPGITKNPLSPTGTIATTVDADIDAMEAWDVETGNTNPVVVAIVDTGIDYTHPDLAANVWRNPGEIQGDGIDNDGNGIVDDYFGARFVSTGYPTAVSGDPMDDENHGTHVSGIIGAVGNNGIGLAGVAWNVKLLGVKFIGSNGIGVDSDSIKAIAYALDKGASIINASWHTDEGYNQDLFNLISLAQTQGVLFVAAAGNSGINNDTNPQPTYPANFRVQNVISVAATDYNDQLSTEPTYGVVFSNFGANTVQLGAPGSLILSTIIPGKCNGCTPQDRYGYFWGTSQAAPHVAGAAALIKSRFPNLDGEQIKHMIMAGVDAKDSMSAVTVTGGRLNAHTPLVGVDFTHKIAPQKRSLLATALPTTVSYSISVKWIRGSSAITFSGTAPDPAMSVSFSPSTVTPNLNGEATVTMNVSLGSATKVGHYYPKFTATDGKVTSRDNVDLVVSPLSYEVIASKTSIQPGESVSVTWATPYEQNQYLDSVQFAPVGSAPELLGGTNADPGSVSKYTYEQQFGSYVVNTYVQIPPGLYEFRYVLNDLQGPIILPTAPVLVLGNVPPPVIKSFTASSTSVVQGLGTTLMWSVSDATSCEASGGWSGSKYTRSSEIVTPQSSTTFTLTCTGISGSATASVPVSVVIPSTGYTLVASPQNPLVGHNVYAQYAVPTAPVTAADAIAAIDVSTGLQVATVNTFGSRLGTAQFYTPANAPVTYEFRYLAGGTTIAATSNRITTVYPQLRVDLTASPTALVAPNSSNIRWSVWFGDTYFAGVSCAWADGSNAGMSGSYSHWVTQTTTLTLNCTAPVGQVVSKSVTITATPTPPPTLDFQASVLSLGANGTTTLAWTATNATSCTASDGWTGSKVTSGNQAVTVPATTTYTLACAGAGVTVAKSITVVVVPPPTLTLTANPVSIPSGTTSTLSWTAAYSSSCAASVGWSGPYSVTGTEVVNPTVTTTYTLACSGAGGSISKSVTVNVTGGDTTPPPVAPTMNTPTNITSTSMTVSWNAVSDNAGGSGIKNYELQRCVTASCTYAQGATQTTTSFTDAGLSPNTGYSYRVRACDYVNNCGPYSNVVSAVTALPPAPVVTLSASKTEVAAGEAFSLLWSTTNASTCTASSNPAKWSGAKATAGTEALTPITATTIFTLTCTGGGGSGSASATMTLVPLPTVTVNASPASITLGGNSTISWSSSNATGCSASWTSSTAPSGSQVVTPSATTTYNVSCTGAGGTGTGSTVVTVAVTPPPSIVMAAQEPLTIGNTSVITWSVTGATSCIASASPSATDWSGSRAMQGSQAVSLSSSRPYTLTCTGAGGTRSGSVMPFIVSTPTSPDIIMTAVTHTAPSVIAGSSIGVTSVAKNQGATFTPSSTIYAGIYLSTDMGCSPTDIYLGRRPIWGSGRIWSAGSSTSSSITTVTVPSGTAKRDYYVCVIADYLNVRFEAYESNNGRISTYNAGLITVR